MKAMDIYLWRHGQAEGQALSGRDADRRLVLQGVAEVRNVAQTVLSRGSAPQKIFTSPYRRAIETAQILHDILKCAKGVDLMEELASGAFFENVYKALESKGALSQSIILVGHMPDLGNIAENLLKDSQERITLSTGAVVKIKMDRFKRESGKFDWMISPTDLKY